MIWWSIGILIIILTLGILKDTHVKVYYRSCGLCRLDKEFDLALPIWSVLIIVILGLLPIANIVLFITFIIYYVVHVEWDPNDLDGCIHVFSLKGMNIITKFILVIKNLLCIKI